MNGENKLLHRRIIHHTKRAAHHVSRHTKHFLVPHSDNNFHPHALRPKALRLYSVSLILVKIFVSSFLFILYPNEAEFATYSANELFSLTNTSRAEVKVPLLKRNSALDSAALAKAKHMFANNYFAHTAPDGTKPWAFVDRSGYAYVAAGENLAIDFTDPEALHAAFLASPSHRANILNARYEDMGIAVLEGTMDGAKTILLVEFFGTPYAVKTAKKTPSTPTSTTAATLSSYRASNAKLDPTAVNAQSGERVHVSATFRNAGKATWDRSGKNAVILQAPASSKFRDESWRTERTVVGLSADRIRSGQTATFTFVMKAPATTGKIEETFSVVATGLGRIAGGTIVIPVTVEPQPQLVENRTRVAGVQETEVSPEPIIAETTPTPEPDVLPVTPEPKPTIEPTITEPTQEPSPTPTPTTNDHVVFESAADIGEESSSVPKTIMDSSRTFFLAILVFLIVALLMNVLIEIRIQHPHVIVQTLAVIILTSLAFVIRFHFLEAVGRQMQIL